jgi:hypothetical protein
MRFATAITASVTTLRSLCFAFAPWAPAIEGVGCARSHPTTDARTAIARDRRTRRRAPAA